MQSKSQIAEAAKQHLAAWYSQRPSFALMGEFSAGKSTLLNMLVGRQVLPTKVTVTKLPVIWLTFGETLACQGLTNDGQLFDLDGGAPDPSVWDEYRVVRMTLDAPMLRHCDVIDTPGISDPRLASGSLKFIAEYVDFAIWCTAANQAWRQSEKAAWRALPNRLYGQSVLAVTRADQVGGSKDLQKVLKRMKNETTDLFRDICPIASHEAQNAAADGQVADPVLWRQSGAEKLLAALKLSIAVAQEMCDARESVTVPVKDIPAEAISGPIVNAVPDNQHINDSPIADEVMDAISARRSAKTEPVTKDTVLAAIEHFRDVLLRNHEHDDVHVSVLAQCLSVHDIDSLDHTRVLSQVEQEIEDFAKGAWCRLDEERR